MSKKITIFWFRYDLRIMDNPGLFEAVQRGAVLPIYILDQEHFSIGEAAKCWLHHSLASLNKSLDFKLNFYEGNAFDILKSLLEHNKGIDAIYWNRCYEPKSIEQDKRIKQYFDQQGLECKSFNASLLWEPWDIKKGSEDGYYKVFTHFYRNGCLKSNQPRDILERPKKLDLTNLLSDAKNLEELNLLPKIKWHKKFEDKYDIGEGGAQKALGKFLSNGLKGYKELRNYPIKPNTSKLSAHLHFGEISPHNVWYAAQTKGLINGHDADLDHFLSELGWREFSYYVLYHFPELPSKNYQAKFDNFPWSDDDEAFEKWKRGQTGYPIVDAGMRELWETGFMHNRVRMIVASFLVKNLLQDWRKGLKWFEECLLDADMANNSFGWQWVAGCGFDAAPYFRIFNPVLRGEKFDSAGEYTRRFVPELAKLPNEYLFKPWEASEQILEEAGVVLGETYPYPIVDGKTSRDRALQAYRELSL